MRVGSRGEGHDDPAPRFVVMLDRLWLLLLCAIAAAAWPPVVAGDAQGRAPATPPEVEIATAPVELDGSVLFRVRGVASFPAGERAAAIRGRVEAVARDRSFLPSALRSVETDSYVAIMAGDRLLMGVTDGDAQLEQASSPKVIP